MKNKSKKAAILVLIFVISVFCSYAAEGKGVVTASVLNVRSGPGTNYSRINQLTEGMEVSIVKVQNDWLQISLPEGLGWVSSE